MRFVWVIFKWYFGDLLIESDSREFLLGAKRLLVSAIVLDSHCVADDCAICPLPRKLAAVSQIHMIKPFFDAGYP